MNKREFSLAVIVAVIMRIIQLGTASYWYDEGFTVSISRLPFSRMLQATAGDVHPPGYYLVTWLTARISDSPWVMRAPSVLFSLLALYVTWRLVKVFRFSRWAQIAVVAWVAVSPLQLHYAQEVRMYALLQLEVLALIYLLMKRQWVWFGLVALVSLYTHNYALFYLPTLGVIAALRSWGNLWDDLHKWPPAFIIPGLLWIPWIAVLLGQMSTVGGGYWIQPPTLGTVFFMFYQLFFAYSMPEIFMGPAVILVCSLLMYTAWRIGRDQPTGWIYLTILSVGPLVFSLLVSLVWQPVFLFRGFIGCAVPLIMLIVSGLEGIQLKYKRIYASALIGILLAAGITGHYLYNVPNKGEADLWVGMIKKNWQEGDVILSLNDNGVVAVNTYAEDYPYYKVRPCGQEALGSLSPVTRAALGVRERNVEELDADRIWFISTIAPVSTECEVQTSERIIKEHDAVLVNRLAESEMRDAGVYLIDG